jgi:hypothetical protein
MKKGEFGGMPGMKNLKQINGNEDIDDYSDVAGP